MDALDYLVPSSNIPRDSAIELYDQSVPEFVNLQTSTQDG